jgi:hypothetical protein
MGWGWLRRAKQLSVLFARPPWPVRDSVVHSNVFAIFLLQMLQSFSYSHFFTPSAKSPLFITATIDVLKCTQKLQNDMQFIYCKWNGNFSFLMNCWALLGRQLLGTVVKNSSKYVSLNMRGRCYCSRNLTGFDGPVSQKGCKNHAFPQMSCCHEKLLHWWCAVMVCVG